MEKLMSEVPAQLELMMRVLQLLILMLPALKLQLQQRAEHQPMVERLFPYKTTSGTLLILLHQFAKSILLIITCLITINNSRKIFDFSLSSSGGMINAAEVSNYSGSGSGLPLLIQRSVARQISLIRK